MESEKTPLLAIPKVTASDEDKKIASYIIPEIHDGSCLQLGIQNLNTIGTMIADSDIKDLGIHSEMMCDAFMDLYKRQGQW